MDVFWVGSSLAVIAAAAVAGWAAWWAQQRTDATLRQQLRSADEAYGALERHAGDLQCRLSALNDALERQRRIADDATARRKGLERALARMATGAAMHFDPTDPNPMGNFDETRPYEFLPGAGRYAATRPATLDGTVR